MTRPTLMKRRTLSLAAWAVPSRSSARASRALRSVEAKARSNRSTISSVTATTASASIAIRILIAPWRHHLGKGLGGGPAPGAGQLDAPVRVDDAEVEAVGTKRAEIAQLGQLLFDRHGLGAGRLVPEPGMPAHPYRPVHLQQAVQLAAALVGQLRPQAEGGLVDGPFVGLGHEALQDGDTWSHDPLCPQAFAAELEQGPGAFVLESPLDQPVTQGLEVAAGRSPPAQVPFDGHDVLPTGLGPPGVAAQHRRGDAELVGHETRHPLARVVQGLGNEAEHAQRADLEAAHEPGRHRGPLSQELHVARREPEEAVEVIGADLSREPFQPSALLVGEQLGRHGYCPQRSQATTPSCALRACSAADKNLIAMTSPRACAVASAGKRASA